MIISEPKLIFSNAQRAFREYGSLYNEQFEDDPKKRLKAAHYTQMYAYLRLLQRNIAQDNTKAINNDAPESMAIDTDNLPHLYTNNTEICRQLDGGVPSTFTRRYHRLSKAGLVRKINHGPVKNYEIIINPYLLFIIDASGAPGKNEIDIEKAQRWGSDWDLQSNKIANCNENIVSFKEPFNKIIIHKAESGKPSISSKDTQKDTQKDTTGNQNNLTDNSKKKEKISGEKEKDFGDLVVSAIKHQLEIKENEKGPSAAQKMREKYGFKPKNSEKKYSLKVEAKEKELKLLRLQYATMMVQLMIDYLLKGVTVFAGERNRTISYVAENYFSQCQSFVSIQRTWAGYADRLNDAKRFKENHPDYTPYPYYYFNTQNVTNGFEGMKWRRNKLKWERQKRWQTNQQKLMGAVRRINKHTDRQTIEREIQYVKDNVPENLKAFFKIIYTNHPDLMAKKQ